MKFARSFFLNRSPAILRSRYINFLFALLGSAILLSIHRSAVKDETSETQSFEDATVESTPWTSIPPKLSDSLSEILHVIETTTASPISCADVRSHILRAEWSDPNKGLIYARTLLTKPTFRMAVHTQTYDNVRWKSIYRKGKYYEEEVHDRFVRILQNHPPGLVVDVGMNIGYYSILSATLGHSVVGFEINPANLARVCESLDLNQMNAESPIAIIRRGVSNVSGETLEVQIPKNPGQAKMIAPASALDGTNTVTTITLDAFAQAYNWWETRPKIALLKIDVEGMEPQVLLGAKQLIESHLVQNILTEVRDYKTPHAIASFELLLNAGYVLTHDDGTLYTQEQTTFFLDRHRRGIVLSESWTRGLRSYILRRPLVMDVWFSCTKCEKEL